MLRRYVPIVGIVLATGPFLSCDAVRSTDSPQQAAEQGARKNAADLRVEYDWVGKVHNASLVYLREGMREANRNGAQRWTRQSFLRFAERNCRQFFQLKQLPDHGCGRYTKPRVASSASNEIVSNVTSPQRVDRYLGLILSYAESLSTASSLSGALDGVENDAAVDLELSTEEVDLIFAVTSVARGSAEYWETEYAAWEGLNSDDLPWDGPLPCDNGPPANRILNQPDEECDNPENSGTSDTDSHFVLAKCCWSNWRMAKADIAGGVIGGAVGFVTTGVGAVVGALGGGRRLRI